MSSTSIRVFPSGTLVDLANPNPDDISLGDIVHHLSHCNRFSGGTRIPYSVAEHSVLVCRILMLSRMPASVCWAGLMHDAAEAYLGDVSTPLKSMLPEYLALEQKWEEAIGKKFGFTPGLHVVKEADTLARQLEANELGTQVSMITVGTLAIPRNPVIGMSPAEARGVFMSAAAKLYMNGGASSDGSQLLEL